MKKYLSILAIIVTTQSAPLISVGQFPFTPPKNFGIYLHSGLVNHPVSTKNAEAQQFFNQGLTLIYGFNHDAAYWSFKTASEKDPNLAMAYWGIALALGKNINMDITHEREKVAYEAVQKALKLSENATDNEKAYIKALATRYSNQPSVDRNQLNKEYYNAMQQVVNAFPEDLDAATLFVESGLDLAPWEQWVATENQKMGRLPSSLC